MKKFLSVSFFITFFSLVLFSATSVHAFTFTRSLDMQSSGEDVSELQFLLSKEGLFKGTVSGNYGTLTVDAVRKFQAKHGLTSDGDVGPKTLAVLNGAQVLGATTDTTVTGSITLPSTCSIQLYYASCSGVSLSWDTQNAPANSSHMVQTANPTPAYFTPFDTVLNSWSTTNMTIPYGTSTFTLTNPGATTNPIAQKSITASCASGLAWNGSYCATATVVTTPTITVVSPNGGEVYTAGQQVIIKWKTNNIPYNPQAQVDIMDDRMINQIAQSLFGTAPTLNYATLVSSNGTEYTYQYTFTVPQNFNSSLPSQYQNIFGGVHYKVNVTVLLSGQPGTSSQQVTSDLSDNLFTINAPTTSTTCSPTSTPSITVLSPNGGEVYTAGQQITVKWTSCNLGLPDGYFNLYKKVNGELLPGGIPIPQLVNIYDKSATYTIPQVPTASDYVIQITGTYSQATGIYRDASDNTFTINAPTTSTSSITGSITLPTTCSIQLYYASCSGVSLSWDTQNAPANSSHMVQTANPTPAYFTPFDTVLNSWSTTNMTIPYGTSTFTLTNPGATTNPIAQKSITASCATGLAWNGSYCATATTTTTIPTITVLSPNGGEVYTQGQKITVKWKTSNNTSSQKIGFNFATRIPNTNNASDFESLVVRGLIDDGGEEIQIPSDIPSGNYLIRAYILMSDGISYEPVSSDLSDNTFTINAPTTSSACSINSFTANPMTVSAGGLSTLSWNTNCASVGIQNMDGFSGKNFGSISSTNTAVNQTTTFTLYGSNDAGCFGSVYSMSTGQKCNYVTKIVTVTVANDSTTCSSTSTPSITVLSPNGGEVYTAGQQVTVKWKSCNIPASAEMFILLEQGSMNQVVSLNDGSEIITLPSSNYFPPLISGKNFKIIVGQLNLPVNDKSDDFFTINAPTSISSISGSITLPSTCSIPLYWGSCSNVSLSWDTKNAPASSSHMVQTANPTPASFTPMDVILNSYNVTGMVIPYGTSTFTLTNPNASPTTLAQKFITASCATGLAWNGSYCATIVLDPTPRIAYWSGKVNQHVDSLGNWLSDPNGTSGTGEDKLLYCRKWYPNTASVEAYKSETITTWKRSINYEQSNYTNTVTTDKCVQSTITPTLTVISPNGGETFQYTDAFPYKYKLTYRDTGTAMWSIVQYPSATNPGIKFDLGGGSGGNNQADYIMSGNEGVLNNFNNFSSIVVPGKYYLMVTFKSADSRVNLTDFSDASFTIGNLATSTTCSSTSTPSVTVLSPNGGEVFTAGQQVTVKWTSCNIPSNAQMHIELRLDGTWNQSLPPPPDFQTVNDGVETFIIPTQVALPPDNTLTTIPFGKYYKIMIYAAYSTETTEFAGRGDYSDNLFTINAPPTTTSTTSISSSTFPRTLKYTSPTMMTGVDVKTLQTLLKIGADGVFGRGTDTAVRTWQSANGLNADGVFGPESQSKMISLYNNSLL